jgi:hypothetical protein
VAVVASVAASSWAVSSGQSPAVGGTHASPLTPETSGSLLVLADGKSISTLISGVTSVLHDKITPRVDTPEERSYSITVSTVLPDLLLHVTLETRPVTQWSRVGQFPGGPVALPPISDWSWTVTISGHNDAKNWTESSELLDRTVAWRNATYVIIGRPDLSVPVFINPATSTSIHTAGLGFVQQSQLS